MGRYGIPPAMAAERRDVRKAKDIFMLHDPNVWIEFDRTGGGKDLRPMSPPHGPIASG